MIRRIFKSRTFLIIITIIFFLLIRHFINKGNDFYIPEYDFMTVNEKDSYEKIFRYTGLSPAAAKELAESKGFNTIKRLNDLYFKKPDIKLNYIAFPITAEEKKTDSPTPLAPLKNGDILVTFNTHTLDWRHGHLGLVVDEKNGLILEHMSVGQTSGYGYAPYWGEYASFAVLRPCDEKKAKEAASYAKKHLTDVPYSIFAGLIKKDKSDEEKISRSHCSHIVWQAYKAVGIDIDSNGGSIVTPRDVAMSDQLKTVQIFGMNPEKFKSRLAK